MEKSLPFNLWKFTGIEIVQKGKYTGMIRIHANSLVISDLPLTFQLGKPILQLKFASST